MIRVFIVDDHAVLRYGLQCLLAAHPGLQVVGEASSGQELLDKLPVTPTDVVLLDCHMPGLDGATTALQLQLHYPAVRVLVLTMSNSEASVRQMLDAGALGYVLKNANVQEIVHGIRTVAAGRAFLSSEVGLSSLHKLTEAAAPAQDEPPLAVPIASLTKREREVLQLIVEGLTNAEMAEKLFTSKRTVETHRQNIIAKTQAKNTAALVRFAVSAGLVS
jgi:DNA-binding NarL/FixJ family response regulator